MSNIFFTGLFFFGLMLLIGLLMTSGLGGPHPWQKKLRKGMWILGLFAVIIGLGVGVMGR